MLLLVKLLEVWNCCKKKGKNTLDSKSLFVFCFLITEMLITYSLITSQENVKSRHLALTNPREVIPQWKYFAIAIKTSPWLIYFYMQ